MRSSLESLFSLSDFEDGRMGCAEEALDHILSHLHRECLHPNYLEEYFILEEGAVQADREVDPKATDDFRFQINKNLDDAGCTPKCPAHLTFGLDLCEILTCDTCDIQEDVSELRREFCHPVYVEELL